MTLWLANGAVLKSSSQWQLKEVCKLNNSVHKLFIFKPYRVENIVREGEIACYKQFLHFSQCLVQLYIFSASKCGIVWQWVKKQSIVLASISKEVI